MMEESSCDSSCTQPTNPNTYTLEADFLYMKVGPAKETTSLLHVALLRPSPSQDGNANVPHILSPM